MIRHIVLIKFKRGTPEEKIEGIFAELSTLIKNLPGAQSFTAGRSHSPERMERGYMHGFVIDFDSRASLKNYAENGSHKAVSNQLIAKADGGVEGILVFDLDV